MNDEEVTDFPAESQFGSSQSNEQINGWGKLLSIRMMVVMVCLWSVICASASTAVMMSTSYDAALSDVQSTSDSTTNTCFNNAETSLTGIVRDLLMVNSASISDSVRAMLRTPHTATDILVESHVFSNPDANITSWEHLYSQRGTHYRVNKALADQGLAVVSTSIFDPSSTSIYLYNFAIFFNLDFNLTFAFEHNGTGMGVVGVAKPHDGGVATPMNLVFDVENENVIPGNSLIKYGMMKPWGRRWHRIVAQQAFAGIILTSHVPDPKNNRDIVFENSLSLPRMSQVFRELAEETRAKIGAEVYLYAVDASSPFGRDAWASGLDKDYPHLDLNQVDYLVAVSNGTSFLRANDLVSTGVLLKDVEATDPVIRDIAIGIHDKHSYAGINNSTDIAIIPAAGKEFIVQVTSIQEAEGIDWWLVSAIEVGFVLGETRRQEAAARRIVEAENAEIDDRLEKSKTILMIVVIAIAGFLLLASTFIGFKMLKPLDNLKHEMKKVSEMNLETQTVKTVFYEVNDMQKSFVKMVRNLKEYKAYVPTAVLEGGQVVQVLPPAGTIAMVFTDIVSSTALWERAPGAMNEALEMHNTCIRKLLTKYNGYEVKTIGDAFMIAFSNKLDAVTSCLKIQEEFVKQKWPSDLELPAHYNKTGDPLPMWNGIRLRMGCHVGEAGVEENPLTGRVDYRGPTVNMAARLESKALPGTLCINKEVHQMMKGQLAEAGNPVIQDFGVHELKGIGKIELVILCPASLAPRVKVRKFAYETLAATTTMMEAELKTTSGASSASGLTMNTGSDGETRVPMSPATRTNKKTGLSLSSGLMSVAVCRLCDVSNMKAFENYNLMLRAAIDAASQTDGVLGGVTGKTLTVVWNASKPCKLHTSSALRFASQIQWRAGSIARVGIATGNLLHGNVGTNTQRFATAFGRPLEAAEAAADVALGLGTFAVIADCTNDCKLISNSAISPFLRMADLWMDSETSKQIAIYEVLCSALMKQLEDGWGVVTDGTITATDAHNKAFRDILAGNIEAYSIIERQMLMTDDNVLAKIMKLLKSEKQLNHDYRVKVWFTYLPEGTSITKLCGEMAVADIA